MSLDNLTMESPIQALDIGNFILPYLDKIFFWVFIIAAAFAVITAAVFLYHWWRYADNAPLVLATSAGYVFGAVILLGAMASTL